MINNDHYNQAKTKIESCDLEADSLGVCDEDLILKIEERLKVTLPFSYRKFLMDFGVLEIDAEEFSGEWPRDRLGGGIPSFVFATENMRRLGELSNHDIMIRTTEYGPDFVIDCSIRDDQGESPVFMQTSQYDRDTETVSFHREKVAESFGEFFLNEITRIIESA